VKCLSRLKLVTKAKAEQKTEQKPKVLGEVNVVPKTKNRISNRLQRFSVVMTLHSLLYRGPIRFTLNRTKRITCVLLAIFWGENTILRLELIKNITHKGT